MEQRHHQLSRRRRRRRGGKPGKCHLPSVKDKAMWQVAHNSSKRNATALIGSVWLKRSLREKKREKGETVEVMPML